MSLYGNIRKVGAASFQFDRKYSNRKAMDENAATDGVYAGRYVLVEYGCRFGKDDTNIVTIEQPGTGIIGKSSSGEGFMQLPSTASYSPDLDYYYIDTTAGEYKAYTTYPDRWTFLLEKGMLFKKVQSITYQLIRTDDGRIMVDGIIENEEFRNNANIDLQTYGAIYDSTVWQKIYINEEGQARDKYVMVAELNAMAPKLDVTQDVPVVYKSLDYELDNYRTNGIVTGRFNDRGELIETVRLTNAKEVYNRPSFDTAYDTELTYLLRFPKTLNVEIDDHAIDFNERGFNIAYSYPESEGLTGITWLPKGHDEAGNVIYLDNYIKKHDGTTDNNGNQFALLKDGNYPMDTKLLFMSFPALGNVMNSLYNLIYGKPDPNDDITHGALRPYFKKFLNNIVVPNFVYIEDPTDNTTKFVTYIDNNGDKQYIPVEGIIGETVEAILNPGDALQMNNLTPTGKVQVCFKLASSNICYPLNSYEYQNLEKIPLDGYDGLEIPIAPGSFVLCDSQRHPLIIKLHLPTGDEDPNLEWLKKIPALSDILANSDSGLATVLSSLIGTIDPLTGTAKYYLYNNWTASTDDGSAGPAIINKPLIIGGYPQTFLSVKITDSDVDLSGNKIYESPGQMINYTNNSKIDYPHTEIVTSKIFSNGHYQVDYTNWQIINYIVPNINLNINKFSPSTSNIPAQIENQNKIQISISNNEITFTSNGVLQNWLYNGQNKPWVMFDIDTNFKTIKKIKFNGTILTDQDEQNMRNNNVQDGHYLLVLDATTISETPFVGVFAAAGFNDTTFTIQYKGVR